MLNHFLYHLASGDAWFTCGLLFLLIMAVDLAGCAVARPRLGKWMGIALIAVMILAVVTTTPLPAWLAVLLVGGSLMYLRFRCPRPRGSWRRLLWTATAALVVASLVHEAFYHWAGPGRSGPPTVVYIVGDSLTAGMGGETTTWPKILAKRSGIDVRDLSFPGATALTAHHKLSAALKPEDEPDAWVLINIGGNDMLGSTSAAEFGDHLDQLLALASGNMPGGRHVLMQELPLVPGGWAFGAHQRRLAGQYGVTLIPKRILAEVIFNENNVVDGLHLSLAGHERMAELMLPWLREAATK